MRHSFGFGTLENVIAIVTSAILTERMKGIILTVSVRRCTMLCLRVPRWVRQLTGRGRDSAEMVALYQFYEFY